MTVESNSILIGDNASAQQARKDSIAVSREVTDKAIEPVRQEMAELKALVNTLMERVQRLEDGSVAV